MPQQHLIFLNVNPKMTVRDGKLLEYLKPTHVALLLVSQAAMLTQSLKLTHLYMAAKV
jgi:hypothetical protein